MPSNFMASQKKYPNMEPQHVNIHIIIQTINIMANQPPPLTYPPQVNKGLIAGLIKGNQWLINPA